MRSFQDLEGKEITLGRFLGRGGEGAVYSVPSRRRLVAKIYARTPRDPMGHKLAAMVQVGTEELTALTAWPQDLLLDERTGNVVGFLMPRVDGHRGIHALYGPTNRKTAFPDATWAFLVRAARNVAATFDTVHRHGHVIGDVNEGNVVVSQNATVRLIDCDSFQITHLGRTYPCRVGVPLFTPPELQGQRLEDVVRTSDHDRFGLAVLVFQLLFMGRHPFAGLHPERAIPVGMAIREGLFAFGQEAARQGWEPPPFSLRITDVSSSLAELLERAFEGHAAAGGPRPTAAEWVTALGELEAMTVICGEDSRHVYVKVKGSCPWCRIEKEGGPSFFLQPPGAEGRREIPEEDWSLDPSDEEGKQTEKLSAVQKLYRHRLNTKELIAALHGVREERAILVRDPARIVAATFAAFDPVVVVVPADQDQNLDFVRGKATAPIPRPSIELSPPLTGGDREFIDEHLAEGRVYRKYGLLDKAADEFLTVIARFPDKLEARLDLRDVYKDKGDKERAAEQSRALAEICRLRGDAVASKQHEADANDA